MKKRILIPAILLLMGCFVALTVLGRQMIPKAPVTVAWLAPLGDSGYMKAIQGMIPVGSSREEVEAQLGEPHSEFRGWNDRRMMTLGYQIPHSSQESEVFIFLGADDKVKTITSL
ncbi:hypothetical protein N9124_00190 [bacterium]|nr:hypothetical protein [Akkermansiaceae bacterium]MDB4587886.1 hypothetical protein [bacterium]MDB4725235.1 hypothetical protein [Akkermansiaceae bacterium]